MKNCCKNCRLFSKCEDETYWCPGGDIPEEVCIECNPCENFQEIKEN
jgi:hypothetical protein